MGEGSTDEALTDFCSPLSRVPRRLEWIVIWLIVLEVIVGLFESASILGWVGHE